jgi:flagellar motor switch protein FliN/FliY
MSSPSPSSGSSLVPAPEADAPRREFAKFDRFLDVRCPVSVVLGTGTISVRQCIALERNSVLRLSQPAGEDLYLLVNGVPVARGEVVIVDDNAALRLTAIARADRESRR